MEWVSRLSSAFCAVVMVVLGDGAGATGGGCGCEGVVLDTVRRSRGAVTWSWLKRLVRLSLPPLEAQKCM